MAILLFYRYLMASFVKAWSDLRDVHEEADHGCEVKTKTGGVKLEMWRESFFISCVNFC